MWFKEYTLNVLIQPVHLLLYSILVGGAMELVSANMIYAVVAIGFMVPAEKLIRKFFGFDNAGTLSAAGSFAGGAVFSAMINKMNRPKPGGGAGGEKEGPKPVRKSNSGGGGVNATETLTGSSSGATTPPSGGGTGGPTPPSGGPTGGPTPPSGGPTGGPTPPSGDPTGSSPPSGNPTGRPIPPGGGSGRSGGKPDWMKSNRITVWDRMKKEGALGDAARAVGYRYQNKLKNAAKTMPRRLRRAAVGGIAGGGMALAGAAVGIASGDPSKAFQYAAAGGAAGYYGANYYGDKVAKEVVEASKDAGAAFWGKDAKQRSQYLYDKEFMSNPENINAITKALGSRDKAKEAIKDGSVQALLNNGITDPGKVAKALKLRSDYMSKNGMDSMSALERAVSVAKWNRDAGMGVYEINSRSRESFIKRTMEQVQQGTPGLSDKDARSRVEQILEEMEYFET